jgi:hypothetical protein
MHPIRRFAFPLGKDTLERIKPREQDARGIQVALRILTCPSCVAVPPALPFSRRIPLPKLSRNRWWKRLMGKELGVQ